ncbi:MAG TPA: hypothetical protein QF838_09285 [SAR202 cluster bacterium]|jgi:hypothetical protein|nr:hypothetical protein [SAR202 cluster bacterium]|tara:strand:+ start:9720 stop:10349 length:630 start_codon:yes stop_codon:yes gene_type:complete
MNSKVVGIMLILGPILIMGVWIGGLVPDTASISPSEAMTTVLAEKNLAEIGSLIQIFGVIAMFAGLYFLARSLKSDNAVSNQLAEMGGLLLLLVVPIWVVFMGSWTAAIGAAEKFGNDVGTTILASSTMFEAGGMLLIVGLVMLGISLTILKKYKGVIGALFIIAPVCAFIDVIFDIEALAIIGWMGMFITTLIIGILTTLQKENQPEA